MNRQTLLFYIFWLLSLCVALAPTWAPSSPLYGTDHFDMISSQSLFENTLYDPRKKSLQDFTVEVFSSDELLPRLQQQFEKITASHLALIFLSKNSHSVAAEKEMQYFLELLIELNYLLQKNYRNDTETVVSVLKSLLQGLNGITEDVISQFSYNERQRAQSTLQKVSDSVFGEELNQAYQALALQSFFSSKAKVYPVRMGTLLLSVTLGVTVGFGILLEGSEWLMGESVLQNLFTGIGLPISSSLASFHFLWKKAPEFVGKLQYGFQSQLDSLKENYSQCLSLMGRPNKTKGKSP